MIEAICLGQRTAGRPCSSCTMTPSAAGCWCVPSSERVAEPSRPVTAERGFASRRCSPDVMLLDVEMPELDGYGVLAAMQALPTCPPTPVAMISGVEDRNAVMRIGGLRPATSQVPARCRRRRINCLTSDYLRYEPLPGHPPSSEPLASPASAARPALTTVVTSRRGPSARRADPGPETRPPPRRRLPSGRTQPRRHRMRHPPRPRSVTPAQPVPKTPDRLDPYAQFRRVGVDRAHAASPLSAGVPRACDRRSSIRAGGALEVHVRSSADVVNCLGAVGTVRVCRLRPRRPRLYTGSPARPHCESSTFRPAETWPVTRAMPSHAAPPLFARRDRNGPSLGGCLWLIARVP